MSLLFGGGHGLKWMFYGVPVPATQRSEPFLEYKRNNTKSDLGYGQSFNLKWIYVIGSFVFAQQAIMRIHSPNESKNSNNNLKIE